MRSCFRLPETDRDCRFWAIYDQDVYDLSDYFNTLTTHENDPTYEFLNSSISDLFKEQPGQDLTKELNAIYATMDSGTAQAHQDCLANKFFVGKTDFRDTPRCQVANYLMLAASIILMSSMAIKCT
jgi:chitin synthase